MKKFLILITAIVIAQTTNINAQDLPGWDWNVYKINQPYPGYVIKLTGDTIQGFILLNLPTDNQDKVTFLPTEKDYKNKTVYKSDDLKGYMVADKVYRSIHYSGGLFSKPVRYVLVNKDGRLCRYYWYNKNELTRQIESVEVFQKADETPFTADKFALKFAKFWGETLSDDPELSAKIIAKEKNYTLLNMYAFIDEYNAFWAAKK